MNKDGVTKESVMLQIHQAAASTLQGTTALKNLALELVNQLGALTKINEQLTIQLTTQKKGNIENADIES